MKLCFKYQPKTVMRVAEARGVVIYEATQAGLKILRLPATNKNGDNGLWTLRQDANK